MSCMTTLLTFALIRLRAERKGGDAKEYPRSVLAAHRIRSPIMSMPAGAAHTFGVVCGGPSLVFVGVSHFTSVQKGAP
jgi:hypothetical protein